MKEYKIGEEFERDGKRYCVVEHNPLQGISCYKCKFSGIELISENDVWCNASNLACCANNRADHTDVYFEEVVK